MAVVTTTVRVLVRVVMVIYGPILLLGGLTMVEGAVADTAVQAEKVVGH